MEHDEGDGTMIRCTCSWSIYEPTHTPDCNLVKKGLATAHKPPMKPTIHLNGSNKERLLEGICDIGRALNTALGTMNKNWPNGRDYYPQGPAAFTEADKEWNDRRDRVGAVLEEFQALAEMIGDAEPGD